MVERPVPTAISGLADDFLADCRARGLSVRTVEAYEYPVRHEFLPWAASEGITEAGQLTPQLAGRFTARLLEVGGKRGALIGLAGEVGFEPTIG